MAAPRICLRYKYRAHRKKKPSCNGGQVAEGSIADLEASEELQGFDREQSTRTRNSQNIFSGASPRSLLAAHRLEIAAAPQTVARMPHGQWRFPSMFSVSFCGASSLRRACSRRMSEFQGQRRRVSFPTEFINQRN